jgi:hypothetical protein
MATPKVSTDFKQVVGRVRWCFCTKVGILALPQPSVSRETTIEVIATDESDTLEGFGYVFVGVAEGDWAAVGAGGGVFGFG